MVFSERLYNTVFSKAQKNRAFDVELKIKENFIVDCYQNDGNMYLEVRDNEDSTRFGEIRCGQFLTFDSNHGMTVLSLAKCALSSLKQIKKEHEENKKAAQEDNKKALQTKLHTVTCRVRGEIADGR